PALAGVSLLLAVSGAAEAQEAPYRWTISASPTDPFVITTSPGGGLQTFYLWLECCNLPDPLQDGMQATELAVVTTGALLHLATKSSPARAASRTDRARSCSQENVCPWAPAASATAAA
ncbi:MAG: hypothetical protein ACRDGR_07825, partial [bacterium]